MEKSSNTPSSVNFLVQVEEGADIARVAEALREVGLQVEQELPIAGVIGGSGSPDLLSTLSEVEGVEFAREEGGVQLPPMSEEVPQ